MHHPKWDERPLLIVQLKQGQQAKGEPIADLAASEQA
jgi:fatty-acyl-CoA synthase